MGKSRHCEIFTTLFLWHIFLVTVITVLMFIAKQTVLDAGVLWTGAFTIWMQHLTEGKINPYAWTDCKLGRAMQYFCQQYSSSLLVIMAVEKCFTLYLPLQTKRFCTVGTAKKISLISAFIFFAFNHPEGTSIGSDNCDLLKVSDFNGSQ